MSPNAPALLHRLTSKAKIRHLQVLVRLAELKTMRRTAESVGITQPAVTQLVAELEALTGVKLFLRHARGVEPTPITLDLLPLATRILEAVADGAEVVTARLEENGGVVRISATPAAIGGMLHPVVPLLAERNPRLMLSVAEASGSDPFAPIAAGACDILCLREPEVAPKGWIFTPCLDDALVVVCAADNPLSRSGQATLAELGQSRWLLNRVGSIARTRFEHVASREGWPEGLRCAFVMHIPSLTFQMLASGNYLAIIPQSAALPWIRAGSVVELETPMTQPLRPLGFLRSDAHPSNAARIVAAALQRC